MAQVLAPIVQSSSTITMLHSSSDAFSKSPTQPHHQQQRSSQMPRPQPYNAPSTSSSYRSSSAPIAPYAFSSTPQLRQENRSPAATSQPPLQQQQQQQQQQPLASSKLGHPSHPSSSSDSTVSTSGSSSRSVPPTIFASKDDSAVQKSPATDDLTSSISFASSSPDLSFSVSDAPVKPSPGRYRRGAGRSDSTNSVTLSSTPTPTQQSPAIGGSTTSATIPPSLDTAELPPPVRPGHNRASSVDDMQMPRGPDQAKRYRRRSLSGLDANAVAATTTAIAPIPASTSPVIVPKRPTQGLRPASSHGSRPNSSQSHERQGSAGSVSSNASNRPSSRQNSQNPALASSASKAPEATRRHAPSPLSQPMSPNEPSSTAKTAAPVASPAMKHLTALNEKDQKGMKSRLRRAFSFGSAAELRRASAENNLSAGRAKLKKDQLSEDDAEQAAIVAKQEAAGIGAGIYSGQGGFTGSNDNLSISSTASSASIMLRKMGSGMKKGSRSIKGLFRPKSVIGVPAADGPITRASVGQVSMVTVEAERQKVNVNADPHDHTGGGTSYPRLERNSIDAGRSTDLNGSATGSNESFSRKSIIGGERERAEVLSSIKKGILKRNGGGSGASSPVPHEHETPKASAPNASVQEPVSDYFTKPPRLANPSTRSLPNTPHGVALRNITFSPRIQFHDAWSASDYDRRGEIATCNRLTPMLAQQIKEELNSFKMEMEVHEQSKPHTHFF